MADANPESSSRLEQGTPLSHTFADLSAFREIYDQLIHITDGVKIKDEPALDQDHEEGPYLAAEKKWNEESLNIKKKFPLLGDFLFRITGPISSFSRVKYLIKNHPELYEILKEERKKILKLTGVTNLGELKNQSDNQEMIDRVRENIARSAADILVPDYVKDEYARLKLSERELYDLGVQAESILDYVDNKFFPMSGEVLSEGLTDVKNCHDVGKLTLIASDDGSSDNPNEHGWEDTARNRALVKLALIEILAKIDQNIHERMQSDHGLAYFDQVMNKEGVYSFKGGKKKGYFDVKFLVTTHEKDDHKCINWDLVENEEEALKLAANDDKELTTMALRKFEVENEDGELVEIEGMVDTRVKTITSMALKMLRKDSDDAEEVLKDLNGVRLVFKNNRDIELFEKSLERKLGKNHEVEITRSKTEVADGGLKCKKHNILIDGRKYEMQIFTFQEYTDYLYQSSVSWPEYEIDRFFESSSSHAFYPGSMPKYEELDREENANRARKTARMQNSRVVHGGGGLSDRVAA